MRLRDTANSPSAVAGGRYSLALDVSSFSVDVSIYMGGPPRQMNDENWRDVLEVHMRITHLPGITRLLHHIAR